MDDQLDDLTDFVCNKTLISASKLQGTRGGAITSSDHGQKFQNSYGIDEFGEALLKEIDGLSVPQVCNPIQLPEFMKDSFG